MGKPLKRLNWEEMAARLWLIRQKIGGQYSHHFCLELLLLAIAEGRLGGLVTSRGANLHEFLLDFCEFLYPLDRVSSQNGRFRKPNSIETADDFVDLLRLVKQGTKGEVQSGTSGSVKTFLVNLLNSTGQAMGKILPDIPPWTEGSLPEREREALKEFLEPFQELLTQGLTATQLLGHYLGLEDRASSPDLFVAVRAFVIARTQSVPPGGGLFAQIRYCAANRDKYDPGVSAFAEKLLKVKGE